MIRRPPRSPLFPYTPLFRPRPEDGRLLVAVAAGEPPGRIVDEVERLGARISSLDVTQEGDRRRLELDVVLPRDLPIPRLVSDRSEEHTSELQSQSNLVCRLL